MTLQSEQVILASPMSFAGATRRAWRLTRHSTGLAHAAAVTGVIILLAFWWTFIASWYVGMWALIWPVALPYRLIRRHFRKEHQRELRHRELLNHHLGK